MSCLCWLFTIQGGKPNEANDAKPTNEIQTTSSGELKEVVHGAEVNQVDDEQQKAVAASS